MAYRDPPRNNPLRKLRREARLTQAAAAALVGVSPRSWKYYEFKDRTPPQRVVARFIKRLKELEE